MKNYLIPALISGIVAALIGVLWFHTPSHPLGATPGSDFYNQVIFNAGVQNSTIVATSSANSVTLTAAEFRQWANAAVVSYTPQLPAPTITLPASSTIAFLVPKPGDRQTFCIRNATSTAGTLVTIAGATGVNLLVATTTAGTPKVMNTGKVACITLVRQAATATTFDIDALMTSYN